MHLLPPGLPPLFPTSNNAEAVNTDSGRDGSIYIASLHWNDEALIRDHWRPAIVEIIGYFGADNVYISIIESGSWDDTKGAHTATHTKVMHQSRLQNAKTCR